MARKKTKLSHPISPYREFTQKQWAQFGADIRLRFSQAELCQILSLNDRVTLEEVEDVYIPLCELILMYVRSYRSLQADTRQFLRFEDAPVPFIIGVAGSVAVGKSTSARLLQTLLAQMAPYFKVDLITTDGFLYPNQELENRGILNRKGFPESYDRKAILSFLSRIKAGEKHVEAPVYSHLVYDIVQGAVETIKSPDILVVEGLNVLQPGQLPKDGQEIPFVSDHFDFSVYVDADNDVVEDWYIGRFMKLRQTAFKDPKSYFHRYSSLSDDEAISIAREIWQSINLINLKENILPTRQRADLILRKEKDHHISKLLLRRL